MSSASCVGRPPPTRLHATSGKPDLAISANALRTDNDAGDVFGGTWNASPADPPATQSETTDGNSAADTLGPTTPSGISRGSDPAPANR